MSASGVLWTIAVAALSTSVTTVPPSELTLDDIPGYERTSLPGVDLTYDEYAAAEPDSVGHLDPESDAAAGLRAAREVWSDATTSLTIELVLAVDETSATSFVDQTAAQSIAIGLAATDPPFGGAWSYSGGLDTTWTNVVSWNQGPYAVTMTQTANRETERTDIDAAAVRQAEIILEATGATVSEDGAVADDAPPPPTDGTEPTVPPAAADDGGPAALVVAALVAAVAAAVALVLLRRRRGATVDGS